MRNKSYGARYAPAPSLAVAPTYAQGGAQWVTVTNDSDFTWTRDSIRLGYHLRRLGFGAVVAGKYRAASGPKSS